MCFEVRVVENHASLQKIFLQFLCFFPHAMFLQDVGDHGTLHLPTIVILELMPDKTKFRKCKSRKN